MRAKKGVAHRYAEALVNIMADSGAFQELEEQLNRFLAFQSEHPGIGEVVEDPSLARADKAQFIAEAAELLQLGEVLKGLLHLLIYKERYSILADIAREYRSQYQDRMGIMEVEVRSVLPLNETHLKRIDAMVHRMTGKTTEIRVIQDPSLLGGLVVRMGNTVLDGSVKNHLQRILRKISYTPGLAD